VADHRASALGEFIRHQRELHALSMRQVASMAGISNPYLSQIERGLRAPSDQVLESIAASLQMSAEAMREQAGVPDVPPDAEVSDVVTAIRADPRLSAAQRRAMLEVYQAFTR
jgi:transcriptional regulator with XRE-family HTH domain